MIVLWPKSLQLWPQQYTIVTGALHVNAVPTSEYFKICRWLRKLSPELCGFDSEFHKDCILMSYNIFCINMTANNYYNSQLHAKDTELLLVELWAGVAAPDAKLEPVEDTIPTRSLVLFLWNIKLTNDISISTHRIHTLIMTAINIH